MHQDWAPCGRVRPRGTRCSRWCGRRRVHSSRGSRRSVEVGVARAVVPRVVARRRRRGGAGGVAHRVVVEQNDPGHTSRCFAGLHCTVTLATPQGALQTTVLHTFLKCGVMASCAHRDSSARVRRSAGKAWREPHEVTLKHPGGREPPIAGPSGEKHTHDSLWRLVSVVRKSESSTDCV